MTGQRSDARRNYAHILTVAEAEVAARGAQASLERIARTAGVGSATVRRHFPTRKALLEAVFRERIHVLCEHAETLCGEKDTYSALVRWLHELLAYSLAARGLADTISYQPLQDEDLEHSCATDLKDAGDRLLRRAIADNAVQAGVSIEDLLTLVVGIALATENYTAPARQAERAFRLAVMGLHANGHRAVSD
ncbi:TetR/AcrR family transcriptional regulator [Streptomyces sp. NPDC090083]|uniref:TetR/AcrR family transcriptional regulator n=1 Tax=Streptomyces sp. NPDC090083 TaxID=3365941 RepID=UPI003827EAF4